MRVVCDNCGASYKIPDSKLTREVNKATCRKCGNPILIRRPDAAPAQSAAAPANTTDERTLITSAAELERQARSRASSTFDEGSMDPRPTQVTPDHSHTEATVPRDDEAERAAAGFRRMEAPSEANTHVQTASPTATLVPDGYGAPIPAAPSQAPPGFPPGGFGAPLPSQQLPGPLPPPGVSPQRAAAAYEQPAAPVPPPPFGRPNAAARAPAPTLAPVAPPPAMITPTAPAPSLVAPTPARASGHNPSGDLTFALLLSLVSVFGVLLVISNALLQLTAVAAIGTFLALLGSVGSALVVLTSGRGTRPASIVLSAAGGFFLAFIGAAAQGVAGYTSTPAPLVAAVPTPAKVPETPKVEPAPPAAEAPAADPLAALASAPPEPTTPAAPEPTPPVPAVVAAPPPAPVAAPKPTPAPAAPKPAPERITPKPAPEPVVAAAPKSTSSSTSTKSTSSSTSAPKPAPAPAETPAKATSLDTRVIDTMIRNNKSVKKCFIVEKGNSGSIPSGVKVKLTVQSSGTVSSAKIPSGEWAATDFDSCLSAAVKGIQFPPFDGDPLTLTYPFSI